MCRLVRLVLRFRRYEDDDTPDYAQKWLSKIRRGSSVRVKCMNKVEAFDEVVMAQLGRGKLFAFPATGLDGFGCLDGFGGFEADTNEMQPEQCVHKRHDEVRKRAEGWSDFCNVKPYLVPPKVKVRTRTKGLVDSQNLSAADTVEIAALKKRIRTGLKTRKKKRFGEKIVPD